MGQALSHTRPSRRPATRRGYEHFRVNADAGLVALAARPIRHPCWLECRPVPPPYGLPPGVGGAFLVPRPTRDHATGVCVIPSIWHSPTARRPGGSPPRDRRPGSYSSAAGTACGSPRGDRRDDALLLILEICPSGGDVVLRLFTNCVRPGPMRSATR